MIITGITVEQFTDAVALAGHNYGDNLLPEIGTKYSQTRFNARVLPAQTGYRLYGRGDELAPGQRRSWQGRRINAVCWHVYRDVLFHVFNMNPNARVKTAMADYRGMAGFLREYPATGYKNVGSMMQPAQMMNLCDCGATAAPVLEVQSTPVQHKPTAEEQEMIDWWAAQSDRIRARTAEFA